MSADLLAEFESFASAPVQQTAVKPTTQPAPPVSDPFALLAGSQSTGLPATTHNQPWSIQSQAAQPSAQDDEDDGWGDFEVAPPTPNTAQAPAPAPPSTTSKGSSAAGPSPMQNPALRPTRVKRADTIEIITNSLIDVPESSTSKASARTQKPAWLQQPPKPAPKPSVKPSPQRPPIKAANSNVLFDADEFDGEGEGQGNDQDDDFGDFESVNSPSFPPDQSFGQISAPIHNHSSKPSDLLAGLTLQEPRSPYPQAPRSPSFHDRNPFPGLALARTAVEDPKPAQKSKETPVTAWPGPNASPPLDEIDDGWGEFDDFSALPDTTTTGPTSATSKWNWNPVEPPKQTKPVNAVPKAAPKSVTSPTNEADSSWDWDPADVPTSATVPSADVKESGLPPINIPPPSILMSVFPQLFDQANTSLYKPVSGQPFPIKNRIFSDPKVFEFLKGFLSLATVAARVIAGRKQRWHRDKFLSQSMSISAAGSKGMKLAGVDKAQTAREDREAADVVSNWKEQVGRLRSAVAAANASKSSKEQLKIPEISEVIPISTAKMAPTAPKACVVCGLKRNERLAKVDFEVEDSFGEWWSDHWGHVACKRFWLQHENTLRQR
ncbi:hypothetical protein F4780DRAFT_555314 [Xylariomycetidae sp. FL0641]|nr:hypothetical protein F4780DRAFT_555314 [Xylariomycetidae sp. FL0641]